MPLASGLEPVATRWLDLGDLGLQQITDDAGRFVLALDACGHDLVIGAAHPVELEAAHQV